MSFHNHLGGAQEHASSVVLVVHELLFLLEHAAHQERSQLVDPAGEDVLLNLFEQLQRRSFRGFHENIAGETVGHHYVVAAAEEVPAFHVAHEVHRRGFLQQPVRLPAHVVPLLGFLPDVEKRHAGRLHAVYVLQVEGCHDGELTQVGRCHFDVGPAVTNAHNPSVHGGEERAEGRADDPRNAAEPHQRARYQGTGGAGGNHGGNVVAVAEEDDALHHGRVALEADDVGGLFITADDLRRIYNLQAGSIVGLSLQALAKDGFISREDDGKVRVLRQGCQGAFYGCFGAVVPAKTVYKDLDHIFFTYERYRLHSSRLKRRQAFRMA